MGTEWVSELSTHNGVEDKSSAPFSYHKLFENLCPWYMSVGMSYDEFWYEEPERAKFYRKAYELKKKQLNEQLYLQGMYFYDALCDVAPALVPKKGAKALPYPSEPYPLTEAEKEAQEQREIERKQAQMLKLFTSKALAINANKGGGKNG